MRHISPIRATGYSKLACFVAVLITSLFFWNISSAQTDNVDLLTTKFKPAGQSDDCATCLSIGIQGSIDFAKLHETVPGAPPGYSASPYKTKVGFNAGVFASKGILQLGPGYLGAMAGLEFIEKGAKYSVSPVTETIGLNYIELPIDVLYQYQIQDIGTAFLGLGPYFAYGIGGKDKYSDGTTTTTNGSFSEASGAKRFDFGLQFTGGFKVFNMASISLYYDLGLLNVAKSNANSAYNFHDKNGVFGINIAYWFGKK